MGPDQLGAGSTWDELTWGRNDLNPKSYFPFCLSKQNLHEHAITNYVKEGMVNIYETMKQLWCVLLLIFPI